MLGYIYKVTNKVNGKVYIGKHTRSDNSLTELDKRYWGGGIKINNAYKKYGKENFTREIVEWADDHDILNELERFYIKKYNTTNHEFGYNIAEGGSFGNSIAGKTDEEIEEVHKHISEGNKRAWQDKDTRNKYLAAFSNRPQEWRDKLSEANKGKHGHKPSPEGIERIRQHDLGNKYGLGNKSRTGMHNSPEMNAKISAGAKLTPHTKEWNKHVSEALKGKPKSESHKQALRKPKPKWYWGKPDGSIVIMDNCNGPRHKDWVRLNKVE